MDRWAAPTGAADSPLYLSTAAAAAAAAVQLRLITGAET